MKAGYTHLDNATDLERILRLPLALQGPYLFILSRRRLERRAVSWAEVAAATGRSQSQTHAALRGLVALGLVEETEQRFSASDNPPEIRCHLKGNPAETHRKSAIARPEKPVERADNDAGSKEVREVREVRESPTYSSSSCATVAPEAEARTQPERNTWSPDDARGVARDLPGPARSIAFGLLNRPDTGPAVARLLLTDADLFARLLALTGDAGTQARVLAAALDQHPPRRLHEALDYGMANAKLAHKRWQFSLDHLNGATPEAKAAPKPAAGASTELYFGRSVSQAEGDRMLEEFARDLGLSA